MAEWFAELDPAVSAKIVRALARIEQGNLSNVKRVGEGVLEYRIDFGPGYRIYFGRDGETIIILLTGGTKKRQQAISMRRMLTGRNTSGASAREAERRRAMARTKSFKELVQGRVKADKKFAEALLREGIDAMLSGDVDTGKAILRDYIKATVGFEELGEATGAPPKSLIRMFGPRGNPQAKNLFSVLGYLQKRAGLSLHVAG
ncbi:MAG TPA: type II toxin-antitoxin system RelE/ParE family toxin [Bradyrhizobium sp.]